MPWQYYFTIQVYFLCLLFLPRSLEAQSGDCPYPIIFLHGWTGNQSSFGDAYGDPAFENIYGQLTDDHVFHAMLNAQTSTHIWGNDGIRGNSDDDALVTFNNESNELAAGCVYAINFDNAWNENNANPIIYRNDGSAIAFDESDSNESAILKQGYALGEMIKKVLAANPDKDKVILAGHSMGGLAIREYLQRTGTGGHPWWAVPGASDGHKVAKVLTTVTPHRGSNTLGNITGIREEENQRDGLPDYFSEAVRDLRYAWACGFFGADDCSGAYLFGGPEDAGFGWWNEDVDCDGDESSTITGININGQAQGTGDAWNGTYDNPDLPLPTNIHYTWLTSDIPVFFGDGVVAWDRQWLFNGSVPYPSDGVSGRLTDTLLSDESHLSANGDINKLIRGMDEGDYPFFAWKINLDNSYRIIPTYRPRNTPHGNTSSDPDWFVFTVPSGFTEDLAIDVSPSALVATQVDFFGSTGSYTDINQTGSYTANYPQGTSSEQRLLIPNSVLQKGGSNFLRVLHTNVNFRDWKTTAEITLSAVTPLPLTWLGFRVERVDETTAALTWTTSGEENLRYYEVQRSIDGVNFAPIGRLTANNLPAATYGFVDPEAHHSVLYYRLRVLEYDERTGYSEIRHLYQSSSEITMGSAYPNPADDLFYLPLTSPQPAEAHWLLINALGQQLGAGISPITGGAQRLTFSLAHLPAGWYQLRLKMPNQEFSIPVYKQ